jgi:hypothetical protein
MDGIQNTAPPGDLSENRRAAIYGVGIGFIMFDSIIIALRIYARAFILRAVGTDDGKAIKTTSTAMLTNNPVLMVIGSVSNTPSYRQ